jgi:hypothetical protein
MTRKRIKHLVIGGAALAALALGSSASAGAATDSSSSSPTIATVQASSNAGPPAYLTSTRTRVRGGSVGALHHVRDGWIHDLYLTDHQQYTRHPERKLSSLFFL